MANVKGHSHPTQRNFPSSGGQREKMCVQKFKLLLIDTHFCRSLYRWKDKSSQKTMKVPTCSFLRRKKKRKLTFNDHSWCSVWISSWTPCSIYNNKLVDGELQGLSQLVHDRKQQNIRATDKF